MKGGYNLNKEINIPVSDVEVVGILNVPADARGIVLFVSDDHGDRFGQRNVMVRELKNVGLATLLLDLFTPAEEINLANIFAVDLLAKRLREVTKWIRHNPELGNLAVGYFGANVGAGVALRATALEEEIGAVVLHSGRPDLVLEYLPKVSVPTLLIVGGNDQEALELNKIAFEKLGGIKRMETVLGATHFFEEPGTMEQAEKLACDWFTKYLVSLAWLGGVLK